MPDLHPFFRRHPLVPALILIAIALAAVMVFRTCATVTVQWLESPSSAPHQAAVSAGFQVIRADCRPIDDRRTLDCADIDMDVRDRDGKLMSIVVHCNEPQTPSDCHVSEVH